MEYHLRDQTTAHIEKNVQSFQRTSSMQVHNNKDIASMSYFQVRTQHKFYTVFVTKVITMSCTAHSIDALPLPIKVKRKSNTICDDIM